MKKLLRGFCRINVALAPAECSQRREVLMAKQVTVKIDRDVQYLPAIAMRGLVVFPNNIVHFEVGRDKSIAAIEWAMNNNSSIYLVTQKVDVVKHS